MESNREPLQSTAAPGVNPEPFTVKVNAAPPAGLNGGFRLVTEGGGFEGATGAVGCTFTGAEALIANETALDDDPVGFTTVTGALPAVTMRSAVTAAVN